MTVLALLCGLRQACDHVSLVGAQAVVDLRDNVALHGGDVNERVKALLEYNRWPSVGACERGHG